MPGFRVSVLLLHGFQCFALQRFAAQQSARCFHMARSIRDLHNHLATIQSVAHTRPFGTCALNRQRGKVQFRSRFCKREIEGGPPRCPKG